MFFTVIYTFLICIIATTIGAISGVGGGVIIKPVMDAVSGLAVSQISFLSGCTVLAMCIVSLLRSRGSGVRIQPKTGTLMALGGAAGGLLGKGWFEWFRSFFGNEPLIGVVQSVLMILLTGGVLLYVLHKEKIRTLHLSHAAVCLLVGLLLGLLSAFLGIGGGPINLVVLYYFFSMDSKTAALHSLYIIFFSQTASLISTFAKGNVPPVEPAVLIAMVIGGIAGGLLGSRISRRLDNAAVDRVFRVLLIVITLISCYNLWHYAALAF